MEPTFAGPPPLILDPNLCRIPPLIPIEYPIESNTKESSNSNVKEESDADKNKTSSDTITDSFCSNKDTHRNMKNSNILLKELKKEPNEDEVDCSDQGELVIADHESIQEMVVSNESIESNFDKKDNHRNDVETTFEKVLNFHQTV